MAITLVQNRFLNTGSPVTSTALAYTSNVTAGNGLVASASVAAGASTIAFSDNVNGAWTVAVSQNTRNSTAIGFFASSAGGAITVTATSTVSSNIQLAIGEISGMQGVGPIDRTGSNISNVAVTSPTVSTSAATNAQGEAVWALIQMSASSTWSNVGTGTLISPTSSSSSGTFFFIQSAPGTATWNPTVSVAASYGAVIASIFPLVPPYYTRRYVHFYS